MLSFAAKDLRLTESRMQSSSEKRTAELAWITGAGGLIGNQIVREAESSAAGWQVKALTRQRLDLTDFRLLAEKFRNEKPSLVIHCAALSKSPDCQTNPPLAHKLNVEVTRVLAELAHEIPFVFFSTDLVFDGKAGNYDEFASPNPLSVYGETKAEAERLVLRSPTHTVIRTSLNGGVSPTGDRGFNEAMRRAWSAGQTLDLFVDEFRSPIAAKVTARAVWEIAAKKLNGLFHLAGSEKLSRWQMGKLLAGRCPRLDPHIKPGSLRHYKGAPRAPDTSLNCAKLQANLSFPLPGLTEWLRENPDEEF
jgi:dTDP-4-dehydrorhamnose reductase